MGELLDPGSRNPVLADLVSSDDGIFDHPGLLDLLSVNPHEGENCGLYFDKNVNSIMMDNLTTLSKLTYF